MTAATILLGLEAFFLFGALATFEPVANNVAWRIGYGIAALGCLAGFALIVRANRPGSGEA